jgi:hypothetical protein
MSELHHVLSWPTSSVANLPNEIVMNNRREWWSSIRKRRSCPDRCNMFVHVKVCTWQRKYPMGVLMEYQRVAVSPSSWDVRAQLVNTAFFLLSLSNCMHFGEMRRQNEGDRGGWFGWFYTEDGAFGACLHESSLLGTKITENKLFWSGNVNIKILSDDGGFIKVMHILRAFIAHADTNHHNCLRRVQ